MSTNLQKIPAGWKEVKFGKIVDYVKGFAFKSADYSTVGTRIIRVSDLGKDIIHNKNGCIFINYNETDNYSKWKIKTDDLIFTTVGSKPPQYDSIVGRVIRVDKSNDGNLLNQNAVLIRAKESFGACQLYIYRHFLTKRYLSFIESIIRGNANQGSITLEDLFQFSIILPTIYEQKSITSILETWDKYLGSLDKKIKIKRNVKKGLMQRLLNNKENIIKWKKYPIKDVCTIGDGNCSAEYPKNEEMVDVGVPFVRGSNFLNGRISMSDMKFITPEKHQKLKKGHIYENDILIVNRGEIGKTVLVTMEFNDSNLNSQLVWLRAKDRVNYLFLFYVLNLDITLQKLKKCQSGGALQQLTIEEIKKFYILLPPLIEQQSIVSILSLADREIGELEKQRKLIAEQKKYLLNNLLTGRIRLPEFNK